MPKKSLFFPILVIFCGVVFWLIFNFLAIFSALSVHSGRYPRASVNSERSERPPCRAQRGPRGRGPGSLDLTNPWSSLQRNSSYARLFSKNCATHADLPHITQGPIAAGAVVALASVAPAAIGTCVMCGSTACVAQFLEKRQDVRWTLVGSHEPLSKASFPGPLPRSRPWGRKGVALRAPGGAFAH